MIWIRMLPEPKKRYPMILDVGCGRGNSFELLDEYFNPDHISGIEFRVMVGKKACPPYLTDVVNSVV